MSSYTCKVVVNPVNAKVNRIDGVRLNHLPFGSMHPGGQNVLFADGSVDFMSENIEFELNEQLATVNGGESASMQ